MASGPEVFVVDDDPAVRNALRRLISAAGHEVRTFATAREFLDSQSELRSGCVVLDLRLPDLDGIQLHRMLLDTGVKLPVIFLSGFGDIPTSVQAIKSGAVDFLPKPVSDDTLLHAIGAALDEEAKGRAERLEAQELSRRYESLTAREHDVLRLVMAGRLNKQIARELGISEKTVKVHRSRVMSKMRARRVAQLVQYGVRLGLEGGGAAPAAAATATAPAVEQRVQRLPLSAAVPLSAS